MRWSAGPRPFALQTLDPSGGSVRSLPAGRLPARLGPSPFYPPSWSPKGDRLAYTVVAGEKNGALSSSVRPEIALVSLDGSRPALITGGGFGPVFAPDGKTIAFANSRSGVGFSSKGTSIWIADLASGQLRQLTPWRDGLGNAPSSFSPDGSVLAYSQVRENGARLALAKPVAGGPATVLARGAAEPVFSPDGERIAFLKGHRASFKYGESRAVVFLTDLFVARSDGSRARRLTRTPTATENFPSWDPSSGRLAYAEMDVRTASGLFGFGDAIVQINPDGSCRTEILSSPRSAYYGPVWQPGPGREAAAISC
jgi:Tol biopolymer transport system component